MMGRRTVCSLAGDGWHFRTAAAAAASYICIARCCRLLAAGKSVSFAIASSEALIEWSESSKAHLFITHE